MNPYAAQFRDARGCRGVEAGAFIIMAAMDLPREEAIEANGARTAVDAD
jgi:hypothetical protein